MPGKIIKLDDEVLAALDRLARDKAGMFADLLKKYNRPTIPNRTTRTSSGRGDAGHPLSTVHFVLDEVLKARRELLARSIRLVFYLFGDFCRGIA